MSQSSKKKLKKNKFFFATSGTFLFGVAVKVDVINTESNESLISSDTQQSAKHTQCFAFCNALSFLKLTLSTQRAMNR